ncbi:MAG TPA: FAD-binding oxidoreductase [Desulfomonilaceae bacterium]|nr:FAD-binding oxidoreductase [Desulfomonilaceae bacterium]
MRGNASAMVRVCNEFDVVETVRLANRWRIPLTVVSGKTSLTGASVPLGGVILDVSDLDRIDAEDPCVAGPGIVLKRYKELVNAAGLFYPPDPTSEDSCTLGGNVACNASGPLSYLYGPTRDYIQGMKIVLPAGPVLEIRRGQVTSHRGLVTIPAKMTTPHLQEDLAIPVPTSRNMDWNYCKNTVGLFSAEPLDLVDLFIGTEGITGVLVQVETKLLQRRNPFFSLMLYLPSRGLATECVKLLYNLKQVFRDERPVALQDVRKALSSITGSADPPSAEDFRFVIPSCMEWLGSSVGPLLPPDRSARLHDSYGCLYVEQEYDDPEDLFVRISQWSDLVELFNRGRLTGESRRVETEVAHDETAIRKMKKDRQSVPEKLNESIRPGMVKVAADFAVPRDRIDDLLRMYDEQLPAGKSYVFGHIGNAHLHANIIAENREELEEYRMLLRRMSETICGMGGSISGEHGIGKLKRESLELMVGKEGLAEIRTIKALLDPHLILNRGNIV